MPRISPARKAAFRILLAVERSQERGAAHSGDLLRGESVDALAPADRNLATTLVLGVLRWQLQLDAVFRPLLARPNAKLDAEVLLALRLGAFQLLYLDRIPAHAAIGESVELARQSGHRYASGMVNAVLRKLAAGERPAVDAPVFSVDCLSPQASAHPAWMTGRWANLYGAEAAWAICRHGQAQPRVSLRIDEPGIEIELAQSGIQLAPGDVLTAARTVTNGDATATEAFREGRVRIQDEGSQLVAELAAVCMPQDSAPGQEQERKIPGKILDACAAPGGKTLILAERHPQARILACETSPQRLESLRTRLGSRSDRIETRLADASALAEEAVFDLVLADVPCSGTGTLGRNPEIRHRLTVDDLARQAGRQRAILRAALRAARPCGRVVYSTCSLEPEENDEVVAAVLAESPGARQFSLAPGIDSLQDAGVITAHGAELLRNCLTSEGALRLLPGILPSDGFFVASIEKTA